MQLGPRVQRAVREGKTAQAASERGRAKAKMMTHLNRERYLPR